MSRAAINRNEGEQRVPPEHVHAECVHQNEGAVDHEP